MSAQAHHIDQVRDVIALTKPKITVMAVLVALGGVLHARTQASLSVIHVGGSLLGIALLVSGSSALNMYLERELDKRMIRTANRPLPAGRLASWWAVLVGLASMLCASFLLYATSNILTVLAGLLSLVVYVWCYTPLKQLSWLSLIVGSVPGAMPVMLGYLSLAGVADAKAWALFAWAFLWQVPHFLAISLFRECEYTAAGCPVLSATTSVNLTKWAILASSWLLVFSTFGLYMSGVLNSYLTMVGLALGAWFLSCCHDGFNSMETNSWARRSFRASLVYQSALFVLIIVAALI